MPILNDFFDQFTEDALAAEKACLTAIGVASVQVAKPACPVDTGNLRRSHKYKVDDDHVDIGVSADYGGHVHNGTSKRNPNPWLKDAVQANRESICKAGVDAWKGVMGE